MFGIWSFWKIAEKQAIRMNDINNITYLFLTKTTWDSYIIATCRLNWSEEIWRESVHVKGRSQVTRNNSVWKARNWVAGRQTDIRMMLKRLDTWIHLNHSDWLCRLLAWKPTTPLDKSTTQLNWIQPFIIKHM